MDCMTNFIDRGSVESHRYFLARRTVLEMLRDRGYEVPSTIGQTLEEFRTAHGSDPNPDTLSIRTHLLSDPNKKILVMFLGAESVRMATIRSVKEKTDMANLSRMILIVKDNLTAQARQATKDLFRFKVEIFRITDLLVNITKHVLMPKHEILTVEEKEDLLKKYNIEDRQLPRMLESDAVAQYYGLEKGQVVRVTHDTEVTGNHITFRCVM